VAEPGGAHGKGGAEEDGVVARITELSEPEGDVHVGRAEDAGPVEGVQHAAGAAGEADVEGVDGVGVEQAHDSDRPRSKRSLRASTKEPDGCHDHSPHGCPSTTG